MSRLVVAAAFLLCSGVAQAVEIGFRVDFVASTIQLTNISAGPQITAYTISIGDPAFNFDDVSTGFAPGSGSFLLISPDTGDDGVRSDDLSYTFNGFLPGDRLLSVVDIDPDSGNADGNTIYGVMFNNGAAPNALIAVTFSNGFILDAEIPDTTALSCSNMGDCEFSLAFDFPEPGLVLLLGASAAALVARRRAAH